ncbi:MAG TPA: VCBS repeat-containing protein [Planctomycetota bacterium]
METDRSFPLPEILATLVLLASPAAAQATLFEVSGPIGHSFGHICDLVGDTDGDGLGEFLVAAPAADSGPLSQAGSLLLYSGADGGLLQRFQGSGAGDRLGTYSSAAGDLDGDGLADLLIGVARDNVPGIGIDAGTVEIVSGLGARTLHTLHGLAAQEFLGRFSAPLPDQDGDGRSDFLAMGGRSYRVFSGRDGSLLRQIPATGSVFAVARDVNGDGLADFAELVESGGIQGSFVRVVSGADGTQLWQRDAGLSGASIAFVPDADGDGLDELVLGTPLMNTMAGRVRLHAGRDGTLLHEAFGDEPGDRLGDSVTGAGDLDGDGYGDFAAGMTGFDGAAGLDVGAVRAFSGRTGAPIGTIAGDRAGMGLGARLGGGRDVDGDGIPEVVASAIPAPSSVMPTAWVRVLSFVPRGLEPFGTGSPGCLGSSTLLANGVPTLGNAGFALHAANVGSAPLLLIGDVEDSAGTSYLGALFHLVPSPPPPALGLVHLRPLPAPDARGSVVAPFPVPSSTALLGQTYVFQVASLFPSGPCAQRLATSRGLRVTFQ